MSDRGLDNDLSKLSIDKSRRRQSARRSGRIPTLLLLAVILGGGGYFGYAKLMKPALAVEIVRPSRETGETPAGLAVLTASGYAVARDVYVISSKIDGRVQDIFIDRGQLVHEGDTIITIENDEFGARVRSAEAQVARAKAKLDQMRAGSRPEEKAKARADLAGAKAKVVQAKKEADRVAGLQREGIASTKELDAAKADRDLADANVASLQETLRLAELGPRAEEIQMAEADLQEATANLEYAKTQLSFTVIKAPITGTILEKVAKKGEMLTTTNFGGTQGAKSSAVTMADLTDLQVELDVNEDDLPRVNLGQACEIRVDSHPNQTIKGVVDEIAPKADRQKATVQVKVKILDPPPFVRPDVNARVTFLGDKPDEPAKMKGEATLWVSRKALVLGPDGSAVYLVNNGKALLRKVKTGRDGPLGVEVTEGLVGDERIIASNLEKITDGTAVAVQSR